MFTKKKITQTGVDDEMLQKETFVPTTEAKSKAKHNRFFAILLWVLAIAAEAGAIYVLITSVKPIETNTWIWLIALIVIDLILVIVGLVFWKKANRLNPASKEEKTRFFVQNQLGVIIAVIAFLPLFIFIFTNKDLNGKQKGILGAIAVIALVIVGIAGGDFNPLSIEKYTEQTDRIEELTGINNVFWTKSGTEYHIYDDCPYINSGHTEEIFSGTVAKAREFKNITGLCKTCENRAEKAKNVLEEQIDNKIED